MGPRLVSPMPGSLPVRWVALLPFPFPKQATDARSFCLLPRPPVPPGVPEGPQRPDPDMGVRR